MSKKLNFMPFNLSVQLDKDFVLYFQRLLSEYGCEFAEINGLGDEQLGLTTFINNFVTSSNISDVSIDENSNRPHKDIVALEREMQLPHSKLIAFNKIFLELKQKYGLITAKKWLKGEWTGESYLHDSASSTFRPYCMSYDLERLCNEGLYFIDRFNAAAPKHLTTYVDFVGEFVSWNCNRTSGAVGLPSFLIYSYYFWYKDKREGYLGIKDWEKYRDQSFQEIIYKLNQPYLRNSLESAFTNFSIFDRYYLQSLFAGKKFPDGTNIIDHVEDIVGYQKAFMEVCSKIRSENMMTFPVITFSLLKTEGIWHDEDFAKWACEHNMKWGDSNFYISDQVTSLSNCCRLNSDIKELGFFNSIGGTSLEVGSVKVNTINLARIALEVQGPNKLNKYLKGLKEIVELNIKTLDVVRGIIGRNIEKGLLPNYTHETIKIENQYNTIGINAFWETMKILGLTYKDELGNNFYSEEGKEFAISILDTIKETIKEVSEEQGYKYKINIEQVPGESCAVKLLRKDTLLWGNKVPQRPLYSNQWIGLQDKALQAHRIEMASLLDKGCNGGSILHFNMDSPFQNFETAWELLNYISDAGVVYFAFCNKISACKNNHGFYGEICPKCGGEKVTTYQRIVGFLTPCDTYSKARKEEFNARTWYEVN